MRLIPTVSALLFSILFLALGFRQLYNANYQKESDSWNTPVIAGIYFILATILAVGFNRLRRRRRSRYFV